jgi:hypothetical protein
MDKLLRMTLFFLPALLCILLLDQLPAQDAQVKKAQLRTKGIITAIGRGLLQVKTADGGQWVIRAPDSPQSVTVSGSAEPNWLSPGMFVKFTAVFNNKGVGQQPIQQLQVFTPGEMDQLGAFPAAGANAGNLFGEKAEKKQKPQEVTANFNVSGQLRGYRDGVILVAAGRALLRVPVAEKCSISVVVKGYQLMRVGDSVTIDAWYPANQKALGRAIANRLDVTAKETFARPVPAGKRPAKKDPAGKPKPDEKKPDDDKE